MVSGSIYVENGLIESNAPMKKAYGVECIVCVM